MEGLDTMKFTLLNLAFALLLVLSPSKAIFADGGHGDDDDDNEIKFSGTVESLPPSGFIGDWRVSGRTVHVSSSTRIDQEDGHIMVGSSVKVEGIVRSDNSIDAKEIERIQNGQGGDEDEDEFKGTIQSLPPPPFIGDWNIG